MVRDPEGKTDSKPEIKIERLYDKRTVERNIKKGLVSRKDYDKFLKALDDVAEKGVYGGTERPEEPEPEDLEPEAEPHHEAASPPSEEGPGTNSH